MIMYLKIEVYLFYNYRELLTTYTSILLRSDTRFCSRDIIIPAVRIVDTIK